MGESAGGSSIEAHITAGGGADRSLPFRAAIPQSPYLIPNSAKPRSTVEGILTYGNVSSLGELRAMSSADLQTLNALLVGNSHPFGTLTFGISPEGSYVPDLPSRLLNEGRFDHSVAVMTGHNGDEGFILVPNPLLQTGEDYDSFLTSLLPSLDTNTAAFQHITQDLYPPVFDGSQGYTNQMQRNNVTFADAVLVCNTRAMDTAPFTNSTYAYEFTGSPAIHGADLAYTFYDFGETPGINTTVAETFQAYIVAFASNLNPNAKGLPELASIKASGGKVMSIGSGGFDMVPDEGGIAKLKERCEYWQHAPYLKAAD
ncbi:MAG: hypothetical protein Q9162_002293 [Coniocarpon cinnabarinum]